MGSVSCAIVLNTPDIIPHAVANSWKSGIRLLASALLLLSLSSCIGMRDPKTVFVFDELSDKHYYTGRQIQFGRAGEPFTKRIGARKLNSLTDIGLSEDIISLDYYERTWGKPDEDKTTDMLSPYIAYYPAGMPASGKVEDCIKSPHVFIDLRSGKVDHVSAYAGNDGSSLEKFSLGGLCLIGTRKEEFEKVLGRPAYAIAPRGGGVLLQEWSFLVGQTPSRIAVLIEVMYKDAASYRFRIHFAKEMPVESLPK
jgi:hypothetical protein